MKSRTLWFGFFYCCVGVLPGKAAIINSLRLKLKTTIAVPQRPEALAEKIKKHSMGLQKHYQKQRAAEVEII